MLSVKERTLFVSELKSSFQMRRVLRWSPFLLCGPFLAAWSFPVASPAAPVILILFLILEPDFNNTLSGTSNKLKALTVVPIEWERILLVRNLVTLSLMIIVFCILSMGILYFSPDAMTSGRWLAAALFFGTTVFPLMVIGNAQSGRSPRLRPESSEASPVHAVIMIVNLAGCSLPFGVAFVFLRSPLITALYAFGTAYWWWRSLRRAARRLPESLQHAFD